MDKIFVLTLFILLYSCYNKHTQEFEGKYTSYFEQLKSSYYVLVDTDSSKFVQHFTTPWGKKREISYNYKLLESDIIDLNDTLDTPPYYLKDLGGGFALVSHNKDLAGYRHLTKHSWLLTNGTSNHFKHNFNPDTLLIDLSVSNYFFLFYAIDHVDLSCEEGNFYDFGDKMWLEHYNCYNTLKEIVMPNIILVKGYEEEKVHHCKIYDYHNCLEEINDSSFIAVDLARNRRSISKIEERHGIKNRNNYIWYYVARKCDIDKEVEKILF